MSDSLWILIYAFSDHILTLVTPAATPPTSGASQGQCLQLLVLDEPAARVERLILLHICSNHRIRDGVDAPRYLPMRPDVGLFIQARISVRFGPTHRDVELFGFAVHENDLVAIAHESIVRHIDLFACDAQRLTLIID